MSPETKTYFTEIEPLFDLLRFEGEEVSLDVSSLTTLPMSQIRTLSNFFAPISFTSLDRMLNELWTTFSGAGLNYLIDKPRYTSFRIAIDNDLLDVEVITENCGKYYLSHRLEGKAQRRYLYRLLSRLHTSIQPFRHIEEDILFTYDGTDLRLFIKEERP